MPAGVNMLMVNVDSPSDQDVGKSDTGYKLLLVVGLEDELLRMCGGSSVCTRKFEEQSWVVGVLSPACDASLGI